MLTSRVPDPRPASAPIHPFQGDPVASTFDAEAAAQALRPAPDVPAGTPDLERLLADLPAAPPIEPENIFPLEWRMETPKLAELYESARDPGWTPSTLPWASFDPASLTLDQRYAVAYW